ncbi:MAG: hypothetical protein ACRD3W_24750, partial [Terriglobales bacterium]
MAGTDNATDIVQRVESTLNDTSNGGKGHTVDAAQVLQDAARQAQGSMSPADYKALIQAVDQKLLQDGVLPDVAVGWTKLNEQMLFSNGAMTKDDLSKAMNWAQYSTDPMQADMLSALNSEFDKLQTDLTYGAGGYGNPSSGVTDNSL